MTRAYVGDSIAWGTADAAGAKPVDPPTAGWTGAVRDARVGAPTSEIVRRAKVTCPGKAEVNFSAGSNNSDDPHLPADLEAMRSFCDPHAVVVWTAPQLKFAKANLAVRAIAAKRGDRVVTAIAGPDGTHPKSYFALLRDVEAAFASKAAPPPETPAPPPIIVQATTAQVIDKFTLGDFSAVVAPLADRDLPRLGAKIGVGEDLVHAFLDVETGGGGYDKRGRLKMLFEPHIFYRNVSPATRAKAVAAGVAYPEWRAGYPADSYPRLSVALALDVDAALKSASWGIGQVLGENFVAAGYATVRDMVAGCVVGGEVAQLACSINFIKANHLDDELRSLNFASFARGYNGPQYAKNDYDKKLAARYAYWQTKPDTPWTPEVPRTVLAPTVAPAAPPASAGVAPAAPTPPAVRGSVETLAESITRTVRSAFGGSHGLE